LVFNLPKPLETSIPIAHRLCKAFTNVQNVILYEDKLQADVSYTIKWQSIVFTNNQTTIERPKKQDEGKQEEEREKKKDKRRKRKKKKKKKVKRLGENQKNEKGE
jgi:hypothetical protein